MLFLCPIGGDILRKLKNYKPTKFKAKDSYYDKEYADFAVAFIESLCHTKGTWAGKWFELMEWQEQIIRDLFGVLKPNGYRQFNTAYIEIPKKNGKSELAAAVALLLTCGDGEQRAEVYGCAADRQQASIVFEVAADMVRMCPALSKRVKILASQKRMIYIPTNSFYQVLSAEAYSKHGFNIHGVVFDELHTQPNRKLFDVMTKGSGDARMQPLYFLITTAGTDTHSICYETHQKAKDILEGRKIDPTFYPVIYGADESDDWTDQKVWKKANPSLGFDNIGTAVAEDLTGATIDKNKVLVPASEDGAPPVAIGFRAKKANGKYRYFWLYRVKFGIPATNLTTKGESIEFSTPSIEGTVIRRNKPDKLGKHPWKAEISEDDTGVASGTISGWYTQVYEPTYAE